MVRIDRAMRRAAAMALGRRFARICFFNMIFCRLQIRFFDEIAINECKISYTGASQGFGLASRRVRRKPIDDDLRVGQPRLSRFAKWAQTSACANNDHPFS